MGFLKYSILLCLSTVQVYCKEDVAATHTAVLTKDNFDDAVKEQNHFVMFYAPWCGHSKKLLPLWEQLAEMLNIKENARVTIAKVDCTAYQEICAQNEVTGYPTLKFYKLESTEPVKFKGTRDLPTITNFINEQLGDAKPVSDDESETQVPVPKLIDLTEHTFAKHVSTGKHFVKFYAPWCGHCQRLAPTWEELANSLGDNKFVSIAKIDCTLYRPLCQDFEVKGYPTLLWIENGKKIEKYSGTRSHDELKAYVEKMVGTTFSATDNLVDDEKPVEDTSSILTLSGNTFESSITKGVTFVKFYAPWCGHCQKLAPVWEQLATKFADKTNIKIAKVDCTLTNNQDLCSEEQVEGFPTLFIYKNGKKVTEYSGYRELSDLYNFVLKHSSDDHDEL